MPPTCGAGASITAACRATGGARLATLTTASQVPQAIFAQNSARLETWSAPGLQFLNATLHLLHG